MQINCMVPNRRGVVDTEVCLNCAAVGQNTCGYDYGLLRFMFGQDQDRSGEIHVTDLTGCLLRAYHFKTTQIAEYPHQMLMRTLGSITHGLLEGNDAAISTEVEIFCDGVHGTLDVYNIHQYRIIDYKTTRWLTPSKLPYGSHELQVNIYTHLLKRMGYRVDSAAVQYIDLSGPTKCRDCKMPVVPVPDGLACPTCQAYPRNAHLGAVLFEVELLTEEELEDFVTRRRDGLSLSLEMNDPPEPEPSFLCSYCPFVDLCDDGLRHLGR